MARYIGAIADGPNVIVETNEGNNSRATATLVTTSTRNIDYTVTAVSGPTSISNGQSRTFSATVKNQGTVTAPANAVRWYLSA